MEKEIFEYLNSNLTLVRCSINNKPRLKCNSPETSDISHHFICGGVLGLIRYKFNSLTSVEQSYFAQEYHKQILVKMKKDLVV